MSHTPFLSEHVTAHLSGAPFCVESVDRIDSTNAELLRRLSAGQTHPMVLVAEEQTAGRGRLSRRFESPRGCGVYVSVLLDLPFSAEDALLVTPLAALCVCEAAEELGVADCAIKWVNDVYLHGKKVCGILTQSAVQNGRRFYVLGIGANVTVPEGGFANEIAHTAGALFSQTAPHLREKLVAAVLRRLWAYLPKLQTKKFLKEYRRRLFLIGKQVRVTRGDEVFFATVTGLDDNCRLTVRTTAGDECTLCGEEVSLHQ